MRRHQLLFVLVVIGLVALAIGDPNSNALFPPCLFHAVTGWWCPGCGAARAIHALLRGDLVLALQTNAVAVVALPLLLADLAQRLRTGDGLVTSRWSPAAIRAIAGAVVVFGIARNVIPAAGLR